MTTVPELLQLYPKFQTINPPELQAAVHAGLMRCPFEEWGDRQTRAVLLYAAHLLEMEWQQRIVTAGAATAIAQGQAGNVQIGQGDHLDRTVYGQQFREMVSLLPIVGFVI